MEDVPGPSSATLSSGQEINKPLPRHSGVTVAPAVVIVLQNRRRKRPIRLRLENNLRGAFIPGHERWSKGERKGEKGRRETAGGTNGRGSSEGMEAKQDWPLPSSSSSESQ